MTNVYVSEWVWLQWMCQLDFRGILYWMMWLMTCFAVHTACVVIRTKKIENIFIYVFLTDKLNWLYTLYIHMFVNCNKIAFYCYDGIWRESGTLSFIYLFFLLYSILYTLVSRYETWLAIIFGNICTKGNACNFYLPFSVGNVRVVMFLEFLAQV